MDKDFMRDFFDLKKADMPTLRDQFAMAAVTGVQYWDGMVNPRAPQFAGPNGCEKIAEVAYKIADAMLKERAK